MGCCCPRPVKNTSPAGNGRQIQEIEEKPLLQPEGRRDRVKRRVLSSSIDPPPSPALSSGGDAIHLTSLDDPRAIIGGSESSIQYKSRSNKKVKKPVSPSNERATSHSSQQTHPSSNNQQQPHISSPNQQHAQPSSPPTISPQLSSSSSSTSTSLFVSQELPQESSSLPIIPTTQSVDSQISIFQSQETPEVNNKNLSHSMSNIPNVTGSFSLSTSFSESGTSTPQDSIRDSPSGSLSSSSEDHTTLLQDVARSLGLPENTSLSLSSLINLSSEILKNPPPQDSTNNDLLTSSIEGDLENVDQLFEKYKQEEKEKKMESQKEKEKKKEERNKDGGDFSGCKVIHPGDPSLQDETPLQEECVYYLLDTSKERGDSDSKWFGKVVKIRLTGEFEFCVMFDCNQKPTQKNNQLLISSICLNSGDKTDEEKLEREDFEEGDDLGEEIYVVEETFFLSSFPSDKLYIGVSQPDQVSLSFSLTVTIENREINDLQSHTEEITQQQHSLSVFTIPFSLLRERVELQSPISARLSLRTSLGKALLFFVKSNEPFTLNEFNPLDSKLSERVYVSKIQTEDSNSDGMGVQELILPISYENQNTINRFYVSIYSHYLENIYYELSFELLSGEQDLSKQEEQSTELKLSKTQILTIKGEKQYSEFLISFPKSETSEKVPPPSLHILAQSQATVFQSLPSSFEMSLIARSGKEIQSHVTSQELSHSPNPYFIGVITEDPSFVSRSIQEQNQSCVLRIKYENLRYGLLTLTPRLVPTSIPINSISLLPHTPLYYYLIHGTESSESEKMFEVMIRQDDQTIGNRNKVLFVICENGEFPQFSELISSLTFRSSTFRSQIKYLHASYCTETVTSYSFLAKPTQTYTLSLVSDRFSSVFISTKYEEDKNQEVKGNIEEIKLNQSCQLGEWSSKIHSQDIFKYFTIPIQETIDINLLIVVEYILRENEHKNPGFKIVAQRERVPSLNFFQFGGSSVIVKNQIDGKEEWESISYLCLSRRDFERTVSEQIETTTEEKKKHHWFFGVFGSRESIDKQTQINVITHLVDTANPLQPSQDTYGVVPKHRWTYYYLSVDDHMETPPSKIRFVYQSSHKISIIVKQGTTPSLSDQLREGEIYGPLNEYSDSPFSSNLSDSTNLLTPYGSAPLSSLLSPRSSPLSSSTTSSSVSSHHGFYGSIEVSLKESLGEGIGQWYIGFKGLPSVHCLLRVRAEIL